MQKLFEVTDPRGIRIFCTNSIWEDHVLPRHPFMENYLHQVKQTLTSPSFICKDANKDYRFAYYFQHRSDSYIKVVTFEKSKLKIGEVITAYLADQGKKREIMIWPFNNS